MARPVTVALAIVMALAAVRLAVGCALPGMFGLAAAVDVACLAHGIATGSAGAPAARFLRLLCADSLSPPLGAPFDRWCGRRSTLLAVAWRLRRF